MMDSVRIDTWLWAARFFKTRALAKRACELGKVQANGHAAKPGREVRAGDLLRIATDSGDFEIKVLAAAHARGLASVAQTLYQETEASREARQKLAAEHKAMQQFNEWPEGRPSKRDRRRIMRLRGRGQ